MTDQGRGGTFKTRNWYLTPFITPVGGLILWITAGNNVQPNPIGAYQCRASNFRSVGCC